MVHVLAANNGSFRLAVGSVVDFALVFEPCLYACYCLPYAIVVTVVDLAMLDFAELSCVLFGEDFAILHWLHGMVVVVLMDLFVDCCGDLFMLVWLDGFLLDAWCYPFMDCCVMVTGLGNELLDGIFGFFHCGSFQL
jgi:hypothetical protein